MRSGETNRGPLGQLSLLASAISNRSLQVAPSEPGEPAWTDGRLVYLDAHSRRNEQVEALVVQASLVGAGSLDPEIVRKLKRRPALAQRYLALEGHRALASIAALLPRSLQSLADPEIAARVDSPAASLAIALSRESIAAPPSSFGAIRARRLWANLERRAKGSETAARRPTRKPSDAILAELAEDEEGSTTDPFSSPVGAGGSIGRLLGRMLEAVRQFGEGGPPGADAPTHWSRTATRRGHSSISTGMAGSVPEGDVEHRGTKYPEWDVHARRYRPDWCTVEEIEPRPKESEPLVVPDGYGLRRPLARLGMGLDPFHRQFQGDDIDIDAAIEAQVALMAGSASDQAVYVDTLRRRRDLAVLILLDVSGSTAEPAASGQTVHEQQRGVAAALTAALHELGDRVALYAFHSRGRSAVHLLPVKRFDEDLDAPVLRRLHHIAPTAYSRLGAAIRHGTSVLLERGGTLRRLLVVLSDGLAYDHGYEPVYGAADARRALSEARRRGVGCLCLSIGAETDAEALRRVFGSAAHATVPLPAQLGGAIGPLFRSAVRSAEVRRRLSR